jgi:hypothetical protein
MHHVITAKPAGSLFPALWPLSFQHGFAGLQVPGTPSSVAVAAHSLIATP